MNKKSENGLNLFITALQEGHLGIVKYLCEQDEEIYKINYCGQTPLDLAQALGYTDIADYFSSLGVTLTSAEHRFFHIIDVEESTELSSVLENRK